jgi:nucleotide-binding universal stress UspA family protein
VIQITRILCPIDFSEFSRHALDHAIAVARWYEASVTVLHVFVNVPNMDVPGVPLADPNRELLVTRMQAFAGQTPPDVPVSFVARCASDVRGEILAQAQTLMSDLIVIGSHGRSGFERLLLGSVTERVVRKSPCPVMVVPPRAADAQGTGLIRAADAQGPGLIHGGRPRILCAIDFSDASLGALEYAMSLAEEADADLTLLHSIEVPPELRQPIPVPADFNIDQCHAAAEAECLVHLRELVPPSVRTYCHVETAVREGAAYRQVLRLAAEQTTDLIVMGVHGRGAVDLLLFGSNTARVIRAATCPVLIVPSTHGKR